MSNPNNSAPQQGMDSETLTLRFDGTIAEALRSAAAKCGESTTKYATTAVETRVRQEQQYVITFSGEALQQLRARAAREGLTIEELVKRALSLYAFFQDELERGDVDVILRYREHFLWIFPTARYTRVDVEIPRLKK